MRYVHLFTLYSEGREYRADKRVGERQTPSLPPSMIVTHGPLRIGVIHGHQVVPLGDAEMLAATARKMDVDVLISGGTHR